MNEASKTNRYRKKEFFEKYLWGNILDIGAGSDLVCPNATSFDVEDGDANELDRYFSENSFDSVHSSHSLEHMTDPVRAINKWWKLVKPGGYLIVVVPEENMYEQGMWPSFFNSDHKSTFRLGGADSWSPVSFDIKELCASLPMGEIVSLELQCHNFDSNLLFPRGIIPKKRYSRWMKWMFSLAKRFPDGNNLEKRLKINLIKKGHPFDQTAYDACAQIEVVVRKLN